MKFPKEGHDFAWARREAFENFKDDIPDFWTRYGLRQDYDPVKWDFFSAYNGGGEL